MAIAPFTVKAVFDYASGIEEDLSFRNGQIITVIGEEDAEWYEGEIQDTSGSKKVGLFPKNFVQIYEPETPPRPSRTGRTKNELSSAASNAGGQSIETGQEGMISKSHVSMSQMSEGKQDTEPVALGRSEPQNTSQAAKGPEIQSTSRAASSTTRAVNPANAKSLPPPVAEKPATGSFRDRIAAFNKPAAPPVAPAKPGSLGGGGGGFIKKAFVAPPPSKNAYIPIPREPPAQKVYRREEDPEMVTQGSSQPDVLSKSVPPPAGEGEEQPKPTSLKDRIALLQKQQMDQAARQAEVSQKKDKPKRPPKKRIDSHDVPGDVRDDAEEGEFLDRVNSADTIGRRSMDTSREHPHPRARSNGRSRKSKETTPLTSPSGVPRQFFDEANDADQSGAGDTEGEDTFTSRDDSNDKPLTLALPTRVPSQRQHLGAEKDISRENDEAEDEEDEEEDEEEDIDPEIKRRMEIRERMAKMSGGMGMAGMFGPPGGVSPMMPRKQKSSGSSDRKPLTREGIEGAENVGSRAPPVPLMAMPGIQRVRSPEESDRQLEVRKQEESNNSTNIRLQESKSVPDLEDLIQEPTTLPERAEESVPSKVPAHQARSIPPPLVHTEAIAPSLAIDHPATPPAGSAPTIPYPAQTEVMPVTPGYESDDELAPPRRIVSQKFDNKGSVRPASREAPPPVPSSAPMPAMPSRPPVPQSRPSEHGQYGPQQMSPDSSPRSPTVPNSAPRRASHAPPIPGTSLVMTSPPQNRAPPPPPPTSTPASRVSTGLGIGPGIGPLDGSRLYVKEDSDEEVTEYEGDYDTDMAPGATHKDALKSYGRVASLEESGTDDSTLHHLGLPSLGPLPAPPPNLPRAVPPPLPSQPPKNNRQSVDMPRTLPPAPPPTREHGFEQEKEDYDPYKYSSPAHGIPPVAVANANVNVEHGTQNSDDDLYSASPPRKNSVQHAPQPLTPYSSPPATHTASLARGMSRQSLDVQRGSTNFRRSMDASRPSMEHSFIAADVDLGQTSMWWAQASVPPPAFQNRSDLIYEIEESATTRRGGKKAVTKDVYALYMDYSRTIVTAHFEANNPSEVTLEQRHEPPPPRLRQDQLEAAHVRFGVRIAESAGAKQNSVVGDGTPNALIVDLLGSFPDALRPIGMRSYGALVYANLANASVQQFDEIRPGDVVTFRNAKLQGKHGPMHQKYSIEVGKQDHVGLVVDWDGTKKKVRAWEQGRDSKKVKMESFKLGDLRSGEVKVWRIMARSWVGWGG